MRRKEGRGKWKDAGKGGEGVSEAIGARAKPSRRAGQGGLGRCVKAYWTRTTPASSRMAQDGGGLHSNFPFHDFLFHDYPPHL